MTGTRKGKVLAVLVLTLVLCAALFLLYPSSSPHPDSAYPDPCVESIPAPVASVEPLAQANTAFALSFYHELRPQQKNLVFSPWSVAEALTLASAGAAGETRAQMVAALHAQHLPSDGLYRQYGELKQTLTGGTKDTGVRLLIANGLWVQQGLTMVPNFLDLARSSFGAKVEAVDFKRQANHARQVINGWIGQQTEGKIRDLVPPGGLDPSSRVVLTNAIYFKGRWAEPFNKGRTSPNPFTTDEGRTIEVPMMFQNLTAQYGEREDLQVVELPYIGCRVSMVVLLPRNPAGLPELEKGFTTEELQKLLSLLRKEKGQIGLPRFTLRTQAEVVPRLQSLGMRDAFDIQKADFSALVEKNHRVFINSVLHSAYVAVDEEGTEAAAATVIKVKKSKKESKKDRPFFFLVDRPFWFGIRHAGTGTFLFMGRVAEPSLPLSK